MSNLRAWLEFRDTQTGSLRRIELSGNTLSIGRAGGELRLSDSAASDIHAILSKEREQFILRDLGSKNGTFVNDRPIVEAQLTHLDRIRIGSTILTFHAAYASAADSPLPIAATTHHTNEPEVTPAPGRYQTTKAGGKVLIPFKLLFHPLRFWPHALETSVFQFRRTWMIHLLSGGVIFTSAWLNASGALLLNLGFLLFAATTALSLMAMTCSVFFAFDSMPDAPHRLSQSMRFTFCISPYLLAVQGLFLVWSGKVHPRPSHYFLAGMVPTLFVCAFAGYQSHKAFSASLARGVAFSITASVPWNLFMTGLMSFIV